jgi:hypothetical protein
LVIHNIPIDVSQADLMALLDRTGFAGVYDLFKMPCNAAEMTNRGVAFVNFRSSEIARAFVRKWDGARLLGARASEPILHVSPAKYQCADGQ